MPTPQDVKNASLTGEFNALTDGAIQPFIDEAAEHYVWLPQRPVRASIIRLLIILHAAHRLHMAVLEESGGENGGGEGQQGPVTSESLVRVGARSYGQATASKNAEGNKDPLPDWDQSSYGKRWKGVWQGVTPPNTTTRAAFV